MKSWKLGKCHKNSWSVSCWSIISSCSKISFLDWAWLVAGVWLQCLHLLTMGFGGHVCLEWYRSIELLLTDITVVLLAWSWLCLNPRHSLVQQICPWWRTESLSISSLSHLLQSHCPLLPLLLRLLQDLLTQPGEGCWGGFPDHYIRGRDKPSLAVFIPNLPPVLIGGVFSDENNFLSCGIQWREELDLHQWIYEDTVLYWTETCTS